MKIVLIISLALAGIFILFQTYIAMASHKSEEQPYTVIHRDREYEIRLYPPSIMATVVMPVDSYDKLATNGFRTLANYIFGGNKEAQQIPMTTPVYMDINDSASSMSFVMPAQMELTNLPKPNDAKVKMNTSKEEYVAALRFGGFASDKEIKMQEKILRKALHDTNIETHGAVRYLGYNPPYQLFGRRNEVVLGVTWKK